MMKSAANLLINLAGILLTPANAFVDDGRGIPSEEKHLLANKDGPLQSSVDDVSDPGGQNSIRNRELPQHLIFDNPSTLFSLTSGQRQEFSYTAISTNGIYWMVTCREKFGDVKLSNFQSVHDCGVTYGPSASLTVGTTYVFEIIADNSTSAYIIDATVTVFQTDPISTSFTPTPTTTTSIPTTAATPAPVSREWDGIASTTLRGSRELSEDVPPKVVASKIEHKPGGKIFGGTAATAGEYPAFALLCTSGATTCSGCGGALIASQYVLTAASCIVDSSGNGFGVTGVRIGASQSQSDGTFYTVTGFTNHPNFVYTETSGSLVELRNDVSILTLASAVSGVTPLSYNRDSAYPSADGTSVKATGYGRFSTSSSSSTYLRETILSFQTDASCSSSLGSIASADEVVCATGTNTYTCPGDGGGALLDSNNLILGILSFANSDCGVSTTALMWWAEAAKYATWIDEQIGVSTPAPSSAATPAPITVATPVPTCSCFSESTTVQVLDREAPVEMKELKVGQQIFAGMNENSGKPDYETVYGFAHRDEDQHTEYLRITTSSSFSNKKAGTNSTLEITSNHLIFLQDQKDPVPAGSLQVGDVLIRQSINQKEAEPATITGIKVIRQRGLYAPLTKDGTVIVDGFHASSYVSIQRSVPRVIGATTKLMSEQSFFHWWMAPYRIFCTRVAPGMCIDDYNEEEGYINWLVLGKGLADIAQGSSNLVMVVGLAIVLSFCGAFMLLESLMEKAIFWFVLIAGGGFLWWRRLSSLTKK